MLQWITVVTRVLKIPFCQELSEWHQPGMLHSLVKPATCDDPKWSKRICMFEKNCLYTGPQSTKDNICIQILKSAHCKQKSFRILTFIFITLLCSFSSLLGLKVPYEQGSKTKTNTWYSQAAPALGYRLSDSALTQATFHQVRLRYTLRFSHRTSVTDAGQPVTQDWASDQTLQRVFRFIRSFFSCGWLLALPSCQCSIWPMLLDLFCLWHSRSASLRTVSLRISALCISGSNVLCMNLFCSFNWSQRKSAILFPATHSRLTSICSSFVFKELSCEFCSVHLCPSTASRCSWSSLPDGSVERPKHEAQEVTWSGTMEKGPSGTVNFIMFILSRMSKKAIAA